MWIDRAVVSHGKVLRGRRHHASGAELQLGVHAEEERQVTAQVAHRHAQADADCRIDREAPVLSVESLLAGSVRFRALQGLLPAVERQAAIDVEQKTGNGGRALSNRQGEPEQKGNLVELGNGAGAIVAGEGAGVLKYLHEGLPGESGLDARLEKDTERKVLLVSHAPKERDLDARAEQRCCRRGATLLVADLEVVVEAQERRGLIHSRHVVVGPERNEATADGVELDGE